MRSQIKRIKRIVRNTPPEGQCAVGEPPGPVASERPLQIVRKKRIPIAEHHVGFDVDVSAVIRVVTDVVSDFHDLEPVCDALRLDGQVVAGY